jgi:hypothetical protein
MDVPMPFELKSACCCWWELLPMFDFRVLDVDMLCGVSVRCYSIEKYIRGIRAPLRSLSEAPNIRDIPLPCMRILCGTLLMHEQLLSTTVQRPLD